MHIKTSAQEKINLGFGDYTCNWGTHICGFYENDTDREDMLLGFLHQGDLEGDLQFYCPAEKPKNDFLATYQRNYPDCTEHTQDPGRFQVIEAKELYYPNGTFSPSSMDQGLNEFYQVSQQHGRRNVRATAEMIWALEAIPGVEHLMVYESRLNYFIPGKPWVSICLYNINRFSGALIMKVLQTHPYAISCGVITKNPYYQDPDEWLRTNAPEFIV